MSHMKTFLPILFFISFAAFSQDQLESLLDNSLSSIDEGASNQKRINALDDQTRELFADYQLTLKEVESLRLYNNQLEKIISSQLAEIQSIINQLAELDTTNQRVVPLMLKMINGLEDFLKLDMPFLVKERSSRVAELKEIMDRGDIATSEKFRRVMEAYQIENEYGRTIETYRGDLNGLNVDFLRIGRVALMYQTSDGNNAGYYDPISKSWKEANGSMSRSIASGVKIAQKISPPELIKIPLVK